MNTRQRAALLRLAIIAAGWALGEALATAAGARPLALAISALLAAGAFYATRDMTSPWRGGGPDWRGRPIDRDRWRH
jgi:hypothetical protein